MSLPRDEEGAEEVTGPLCTCCMAAAPWEMWGQRVCIECGSELMEHQPYLELLRSDQTYGLNAKAEAFVAQWCAERRKGILSGRGHG